MSATKPGVSQRPICNHPTPSVALGTVNPAEPPPSTCPLRTAIPLAKVWTREEVLSYGERVRDRRGEGVSTGLDLAALLDGEQT